MATNTIPAAVRDGHAGRVHLIAICGVGMAALAGMLQKRGFTVSGSDENVYPPMSTLLERMRIPIRSGYSAENLADRPDLVVVGNKVSRGNPEVEALLESDLAYASFPQALAELFLRRQRSLVVAGTHGKTTSTALLAWTLERAGRDPSMMVGGEVLDFGGNYKLGGGEEFVIEGDEYDTAFFDKGPKFLHYRPQALLLTAVEFDHADIYRDLAHVKDAFRRLIDIVPAGAPLAIAADFPHAVDVARTRSDGVRFGLHPDAEWRADNIRDDGSATLFEILYRGKTECTATFPLPGAINARNALGVFALCRGLGMSPQEILPGLAGFRGVARRQEVVGTWDDVLLVDDFAHHPTAVAGVLAAVRLRHPRRRLWAVFEPRSNSSRRRVFQNAYVDALAASDRVIIGAVFQKETDRVARDELFSPDELVDSLRSRGTPSATFPNSDGICAALAGEARPGDVIVLMSNGSFDGLRAKLTSALAERASAAAQDGR